MSCLPPYVLGNSTGEVDRLAMQARILQEWTAGFLHAAPFSADMHILDVGCGLGDVSFLAGDIVGPNGSVLGIDRDPSMIAKASERALERGGFTGSCRKVSDRSINMSYFYFLSDQHMNYTLNRPLQDGEAKSRVAEAKTLAPKIKDIETWTSSFLEAAKRAESDKRWADAAAYYHQVEFFLPAGDLRNSYYDDFARNYAIAMKDVPGYERHEIPYPGGHLPGFRLPAKGKELATLVFHGGYDSFVEEFYPFLEPFTDCGWTVLAFDGPGQGGALRQGIFLTAEWERFAKAIIDYFKLSEVDWLGASYGGLWALRAAAFEPCIKHVISLPAAYWGLDMTLKQIAPGQDNRLVSLFKAGDRDSVEVLIGEQRKQSICFNWCVTQGMHISGTNTPFDFLANLSMHTLDGVLKNVKQDVLLTEGEDDHLFHVDWIYRTMRELVCARSVTARIFTAREGAEQHCQLGNSALAREEIVRWLSRFHPEMVTPRVAAASVS